MNLEVKIRLTSTGLDGTTQASSIQLLFLASKSFFGLWVLTGIAIAVARLCAVETRLIKAQEQSERVAGIA